MKEKTLSDEVVDFGKDFDGEGAFYSEKEVKEFIKDICSDISPLLDTELALKVEEIITKRAGDKLI